MSISRRLKEGGTQRVIISIIAIIFSKSMISLTVSRMEEELRVARNQFQPGFVQKGGALPHP